MPSRLHIVFLWHMHQPFYYDWEKGWLSLPWVRLHAVKAYYDMPAVLREHEARGNFNLVPSLLKQIILYTQGKEDYFLHLSRKPPSDLEQEEREFILKYFFSCHWETMVNPYPRYTSLLQKRGLKSETDLSSLALKFSESELRDLQVWFNLTWIGFSHREHPLVRELFLKGRDFTEEEKNALLDLHLEILEQIIPLYRDLQDQGKIELSTSPFFHPILPLLMDTDFARRNLPQAPLPPRFRHPEDAAYQIQSALDFMTQLFGQRPRGMWPSEGSVCPELIPLVAEEGITWLATDEEILYRSLQASGPSVLLKPYWVEREGRRVAFIFRHHALSDRIGFVYRGLSPEEAVQDFINTAQALAQESGLSDPLLAVILDGENPWEYYADGGEAFLNTLYRTLAQRDDCVLTTVSEYLDEHPPSTSLADLYTGSWINANFDIWIGHEEENRAWELLGRTRAFLGSLREAPPEAREAMLAAEGSDWFWWYGDHFSSLFDLEFDRLFRGHLAQVFRILKKPPLSDLAEPIKRPRPVEPQEYPTAFLAPQIDGEESFFYEWIGAGRYEPDSLGEAMYLGESLVKALYFGFDLKNLYLRLDLHPEAWPQPTGEVGFRIKFLGEKHQVEVSFRLTQEHPDLKLIKGASVLTGEKAGKIAVKKIVEIALPFENLGFRPGEQIKFYLEILDQDLLRERVPHGGLLTFVVPDKNFEQVMWQV